jgi:hypothetical protein
LAAAARMALPVFLGALLPDIANFGAFQFRFRS